MGFDAQGDSFYYFELQLVALRDGVKDLGLVIGFTKENPVGGELCENPTEVPASWSFGYDGIAFYPDQELPIDVDFQPSDLRAGDRVGLLIENRLVLIFVNGI